MMTVVTFIHDDDFGTSAVSIVLSNIDSSHGSDHSAHHHGLAGTAAATATGGHLDF